MALDASIPPVRRSREWLTGVRPVAGAVGACSLMLLACSWFAFRPASVDAGSDVGSPPPVRIDDGNREGVPASTRRRARVVLWSITARRPSPAAGARDIRPSTGRLQYGPPPAASAEAAPASSAPPSSAAPPVATPPAAPLPPAPVDGLPSVSSPPVSLPQLPELLTVQLPDLATATTPLGLP
jgi:hypothetical protein